MRILSLIVLLSLASCAGEQIVYKPVQADIPVSTPCKVPDIKPPAWAMKSVQKTDTMFVKVQASLIDIQRHKAYELQLVAANNSCK